MKARLLIIPYCDYNTRNAFRRTRLVSFGYLLFNVFVFDVLNNMFLDRIFFIFRDRLRVTRFVQRRCRLVALPFRKFRISNKVMKTKVRHLKKSDVRIADTNRTYKLRTMVYLSKYIIIYQHRDCVWRLCHQERFPWSNPGKDSGSGQPVTSYTRRGILFW